jgi:hypothetical protein
MLIVGGVAVALLGHRISGGWKAIATILVAGMCEIMAFAIIFVNMPNNAVFGPTSDEALLESKWVQDMFTSVDLILLVLYFCFLSRMMVVKLYCMMPFSSVTRWQLG